jgi:hypothetical protein
MKMVDNTTQTHLIEISIIDEDDKIKPINNVSTNTEPDGLVMASKIDITIFKLYT